MAESIYSPSWYRVAGLRPRLRPHARIHRHHYRGVRAYVLEDTSSGQHHRLSVAANYLVGLMDGRRSMEEIWEAAGTRLGDDMPTQDQIIQLLGQLHAADVLQCDITPDSEELFRRHQRSERSKWQRRLWTPLAVRLPLLDPDRFLERGLGPVRPLFGWFGLMLWLGVVGSAAVLAGAHWPELSENVIDRALAPQNLLLLWLTYPLVKGLHELGHGFATKVWGGEVHEVGLMFLVLMPVPYVDASAASAFRAKHRRMVVGAAGILVEMFLAALALFAWINLEPGALRTTAYNVMLIGGVSTLFFNGNPLLRFDAYYVLADALEIPNLGARANKYIGYLIQRYLFGAKEVDSQTATGAERAWLLVYGLASVAYRMVIMFTIILFIAGKFFVVGVLLAVWGVLTQVVVPVAKAASFVVASPMIRRHRARALVTSASLLVLVAGLVFYVPVPLSTRTEGVVWMPEKAQVRAGADGFIRQILVETGTPVRRGESLVETEDPFLHARVRVLESRLEELKARYEGKRLEDRAQAEIIKEELASVQADLNRAREKAGSLLIRSPTDGIFVVPQAQDLPGRFVRQGELVAYVADLSRTTVRVVVPQADIDLVRQRTQAVQVRVAGRISEPVSAIIRRQVPEAIDRLPAPTLGTLGGGPFAIDPTDEQGVQLLQKVFQIDLSLVLDNPIETMGARAYVRFDHGKEPLAARWYRTGRRLFLKRFGV